MSWLSHGGDLGSSPTLVMICYLEIFTFCPLGLVLKGIGPALVDILLLEMCHDDNVLSVMGLVCHKKTSSWYDWTKVEVMINPKMKKQITHLPSYLLEFIVLCTLFGCKQFSGQFAEVIQHLGEWLLIFPKVFLNVFVVTDPDVYIPYTSWRLFRAPWIAITAH